MSEKKREISNATFNDKKATPINLDIEMVENAVINEINFRCVIEKRYAKREGTTATFLFR